MRDGLILDEELLDDIDNIDFKPTGLTALIWSSFYLSIVNVFPSGDTGFFRPFSHPSVRPSVRQFIRPSVRPSVHLSDRPSVCPSVRPSNRPSIRPFVLLSVRPSVQPVILSITHYTFNALPVSRSPARPSVLPSILPFLLRLSVRPSGRPTVLPDTSRLSFAGTTPLSR